MIGMPRITLIRLALSIDRALMPETRIIAQIRPSTVESSSEPMVTTIVNATPLIRIGKNSAASCQKPFIGQPAMNRYQPWAFRPHLSRILAMVPLAFSLVSEALILPSSAVSPLRTPMPTEPTVTGL